MFNYYVRLDKAQQAANKRFCASVAGRYIISYVEASASPPLALGYRAGDVQRVLVPSLI